MKINVWFDYGRDRRKRFWFDSSRCKLRNGILYAKKDTRSPCYNLQKVPITRTVILYDRLNYVQQVGRQVPVIQESVAHKYYCTFLCDRHLTCSLSYIIQPIAHNFGFIYNSRFYRFQWFFWFLNSNLSTLTNCLLYKWRITTFTIKSTSILNLYLRLYTLKIHIV